MIDATRYIAIAKDERQASLRAIESLSLTEEARLDVHRVWRVVQEAINGYIRQEDRYIDDQLNPGSPRRSD